MAEVTVGELAKSIDAPVERLLNQMSAVGLSHTSAEAKVSEEEKQRLLNFLKSSHGDVALELKGVNSDQLEIEELTDPLIPGQTFTGRVRGFDDGNAVISTAELGVPVKIENGFFSGVWPQIEEGKVYPTVGGSIKIALSQSARALTIEKRIEPPDGFAAVFLENPIIDNLRYPTANFTIIPVSGDQVLYVASECIIYPDGGLSCNDPITTKVFHRVAKTGVFYEYNFTINGGAEVSNPERISKHTVKINGRNFINYDATQDSHPETPAKEDRLNRQKLVNALAINLTHTTNSHHRAIGLLGEWGSGKSTVLTLLKQRLKELSVKQPFVFGEFNAWAYEHTDNIQAGVAQEMINALTSLPDNPGTGIRSLWPSVGWIFQRAWLTLQFSVKTHPFEILKILVLLLGAAIPWFTDWFDGLINDNELAIFGQWVWSGGLVLYTLREFGKLIISPQAKELLTYLRLPSYAEHLGKIPVMRKHISTLCDLRLKEKNGKTPRLLFVVDDLDRCSPEAIVKVLEAVRLVLDLENVIVLIAIDQHIALAALSKHFNDFAVHHKLKNSHAIAREYLSKVINLPIVLTAPSGDDVHVFMADLWKDMPKDSTVGASGAGREDLVDNTPKQVTGETNLPAVDFKAQPDNVPVADGSPNSDFLEDVKPTIAEGDQHPRDQINPIKALSQEQQKSFIYWVNYFELTNPRQLKRLNNSYDLMRSYLPQWDKEVVEFALTEVDGLKAYPMLLTLILMEYLNSLHSLTERSQLWEKLFSAPVIAGFESAKVGIPMAKVTEINNKLLTSDFIKAYRSLLATEGNQSLVPSVEAFVLPAMN